MQNENERLQEKILRILNEDSSTTGDSSGDESDMAKAELQSLISDAKAILALMEPNQDLEAWVQSKITKAADYLNSVHTHMKGDSE
jgi:hypothetical protein